MNTALKSTLLGGVLLCAFAVGYVYANDDLHAAARAGDTTTVAALLAGGADVSACDNRGRTALHYAAQSNDKHIIQALLANGAAVNIADAQGNTPLHLAARLGRLEAVGYLLAAGADVDAQNADGQTPLHVLGLDARRDVDEVQTLLDVIAQTLIDAGADPRAQDLAGQPAWPHAEPAGGERQPSGYPTYDAIAAQLLARANSYPALCQRFDLGTTVQNRHIYGVKITSNVTVEADKPRFKYIANIHGDEVIGVIMCLNFIDYLLQNYGTDPRITSDVDAIEIWVVPSMNPDGYMLYQRANANGVDMNRSFPEGAPPSPEPNTSTGRAVEIGDIMTWSTPHPFTLACNFHGGALVVNYPFDNAGSGSQYSPDDDLFQYISLQYSIHNTPMYNSSSFLHGITNGVAWYSITGGMQDWDYRYMGGNEVTIELGDTKAPAYSTMPTYWSQNRDSMMAYMETCLIGVRGIITDANTGTPLKATVRVVGRDHPVYSDVHIGDYHRMLLPGTYSLTFEAAGYDTVTVSNVVVGSGAATRLNVQMGPSARITYPNGGETVTANTPVNVTWTGNPAAQFQVDYSPNYGQTSQVTDGFESGSLGSAYTTGGNANWYVVSGGAHAGTYSARAGAIGNSATSWLQRTVGGGTLSFWYKVSSEANYDWFNVTIDGTQVVHRAGTVAWTQYSTTLAAGSHVVQWSYTKDANTVGGSDTAWIDDLVVTTDLTSWNSVIALTPAGATSTPWTPTVPGTTYKVRVRACYGPGSYGAWDESDAVFIVQAGPTICRGDGNCDGRIDFADIDYFVAAIPDNQTAWAAAYAAQHGGAQPPCPFANNDANNDGHVDFGDIDPFVALIPSTCP